MATSQKVRREVFDKLTLRVDPRLSDPYRQIVSEDPEKECYISDDGQIYEDEIWKVRLMTVHVPFNGRQQYRIRADYKGKNVFSGTRCFGCVRAFDTGIIKLSLKDYIREDNSVGSKIDVVEMPYSDLLSDNFGIWDSYFFNTPNGSYLPDQGEDFSMAIVSDGRVICWHGDEHMENPGLEELAKILQADESYCYEVSDATWAVVIECDKYGEADARIEVHTEESDFRRLCESLERYLIEMELTRFDDILNVVSE